MTTSVIAAEASIEVPLAPEAAFDLYTSGIDRWWRLGTIYWNDAGRATGLCFEPFVGGRFIEVRDGTSGDGFEIGRVITVVEVKPPDGSPSLRVRAAMLPWVALGMLKFAERVVAPQGYPE